MARDEATWVFGPERWRLLGDAEFLLVFEARAPLPSQPAMESLEHEIRAELAREGILGHVQVTPVYAQFFKDLQPRLFAYELRASGRVVWGDPSILSLIPEFSSTDILLEDAWRLLANRMIEYLEATSEVEACTGALPQDLRYRTVKLYVDMGTSLSVFAGFYAPAYGERSRRLSALAAGPEAGQHWPFPLRPFAEQVSIATALKLGKGPQQSADPGWEFWRQAIRYAKLLWRWELARLVGVREPAQNCDLMQRWMRLQPWGQGLRGWAFVWRTSGWLRSWRWWPRWARLAVGGSPRYWVYDAAQTLFQQLPDPLDVGSHTDLGEIGESVANGLPVLRQAPPMGGRRWADLVHQVAWNYHQFLEPTRA